MAKLPTLRKRRDFEFTQRKGARLASHYFNLYFLPHSESGLGITVSKKVSKKAVVRNRIRRVCRETVRVHFPFLADKLKLVVIARPSTEPLTKEEIRKNLSAIFQKIKIPDERPSTD